jgi:hypothetical protein
MKDGKKTIVTNSTIDKLTLYQTCMAYEQSIRTSYQALLTTLVVAVFGLVFVLVELQQTERLWTLVIGAILLCLIFTPACEFRANNVDFWRRRIIEIAEGTDLQNVFWGAKYGWIPLGKVGHGGEKILGHWFERVLVPFMCIALVIWVRMLTG